MENDSVIHYPFLESLVEGPGQNKLITYSKGNSTSLSLFFLNGHTYNY